MEPASKDNSGRAVAALFSGDKLTVSTDHVFGSQRQLLNGPAIVVEAPEVSAAQLEWAGQQPRVFETRVIDGHHGEGLVLCRWLGTPSAPGHPRTQPEIQDRDAARFRPDRARWLQSACRRRSEPVDGRFRHIQRGRPPWYSGRKLRRAVKFLAKRTTKRSRPA